jgi:HTH-type transcriptional regulator / antitoxin HipB
MKQSEKHGFVYVITNSWAPGLTKLGETGDVPYRFKQIASVLPGKSVLRWHREVDHCWLLEAKMRQTLEPFRVRRSRDWFQIGWRLVVEQFEIAISGAVSEGMIARLKISSETPINSADDAGLFCRSWRKREQITQAELADSAGVGVRFVSEFERGKPTCEIGKVIKLCKTIGIDFYAAKR